ncbi:iron-sulfur cluster assembly scaffold protein [Kitasatospora cineracea]|uniref:iron-sulfur cluster assembly scaffold protein n=1 Tax=Kitasatospora cineracea TaxID=88074 RepID=UPI0033E316CE
MTNWETQALLSDHYKNPRHWGMLHRGKSATGNSPGCGDEQIIYVDETDGEVTRLRFQATGCALSRAATSIMLECVADDPRSIVPTLDQTFFIEILGADVVHSRPKCTMLGLTILQDLYLGRRAHDAAAP